MTAISSATAAAPAYTQDVATCDAQYALLALLVTTRASSQASARREVELDYRKLDELKAQLADALQKAREAQDDSGFWAFVSDVCGSDVAEVAGAVAAAAAVIATGGAATPLVVVTLSAGLETGAKLGAELGLDPKLCAAIAIAGAAIGLLGGAGNAGGLASAARTVHGVATAAQGGAIVAGGVTSYVSGRYAASAQDHRADAVLLDAQRSDTSTDIDQSLAELERALRMQSSMTGTVAEIGQANARAGFALAGNV